MTSSIYNGTVIHKRFKPKLHFFKYRVFSLLIDLSDLNNLGKDITFFSYNHFNLISFFSGFLTSSIIDTSLGEFNAWAIVGASLVVSNIESFNNLYYSLNSKNRNALTSQPVILVLFDFLNYFKIGVVYGLIVDAFKLGS